MSVHAPHAPNAVPPPASRDDGRSIADLLKDLRDESTTLVRQEVALAKTELSEKAAVYGRNAGKIAAGGALAFAATVALVLAVAFAAYFAVVAIGGGDDAEEWVRWVAGLVGFLGVPLLALGIGGYLIKSAVDRISHTSPVPEQTIASVKADARHVGHDIQEFKQKVTPR
ncbi:phage holin family protein [Alienimonas sp. DA493]|uniref:phage holin family protein n=1 Tax=Alienimonas sp. DA493 TaxID=3373605 RepID=UPI0037548CF2